MHKSAEWTQHNDLTCAGIGAEAYFGIEEGALLPIVRIHFNLT